MAKKKQTLVIVESPAKAKTIEKYLGPGYAVTASMGHLIDLPKSRMAIDVDHGFRPEYITVRGKAPILKAIVAAAEKSELVLLASDNDREGEAIAWHLRKALTDKLKEPVPIKRIVFNEITPNAIREAVQHPAEVMEDKVNAQKGRRVLDRLVGYHLSPLLWAKVKNGLSAGRVQSVALKLIVDREKEVEAFVPQEYWSLEAQLKKGKYLFKAKMTSWKGEKTLFHCRSELQSVVDALTECEFRVVDIKTTEKKSHAKPPFITSTLQQAAANRLGFTSRKTMQIAQQLYEGVLYGSNRVGLITYMRTDSTRISEVALAETREFLQAHYPQFVPEKPNLYASKKNAQDAHEAIRPTYVSYTPDSAKAYLSKDQFKLYTLIWERFVASQMTPAVNEQTAYDIAAGEARFKASASVLRNKGYQAVLKPPKEESDDQKIPSLSKEERLTFHQWLPEQHWTQGPPRYSDASMVKELEEFEIGRPSTYAPIISVLLDRYYIVRKNRQLQPTVLGRVISDLLSTHFPDLMQVDFTAKMERQLDLVEEGKEDWVQLIDAFYTPFIHHLNEVNENIESIKGVLDEPVDALCPECGKPLVKKLGKFGFFIACTGFPECRHTESIPICDCPREGCGGKIVARKKQGSKGKEFYGCTNYPKCDFISYFKPTSQRCPKCGELLVEKTDKKRGDYRACINPKCDYLHSAEADSQPEPAAP